MFASRAVLRSTRLSQFRTISRNVRLQSTTPNAASSVNQSTNSGAITGGLVGGALVFAGGYTYYHFSGAKTVVSSISDTKNYFESALKKSTENAPPPNEAIKWLRDTATGYAAFIPGARGYVDSAFNDLEVIQKKHGEEVNKIVKKAYDDLKSVSQEKGMTIDTVQKAWTIVQDSMKKIGELAGDAAEDIIKQHPELKEKFGGNLDQLKKMGNEYGPEAKKKVDETWSQIQDIVKGGLGVGTADQIRKLVQEKIEEVKKLGDQAWDKGMEQAKPYLDKNPKIKELFEKNKDQLKNANVSKLWDMVKDAAKTGKTEDIEKYVKETTDKAKGAAGEAAEGAMGGGGIEKYLKMIPGGDEIMPKLTQLSDLAQKHGEEAEKLLKDAFEEIKSVLTKKVDEARKLADKAKDDAK